MKVIVFGATGGIGRLLVAGALERGHAVTAFVISLGQAGEWPLFLDAFFESTIDTINYGTGDWTSSAVLGPSLVASRKSSR